MIDAVIGFQSLQSYSPKIIKFYFYLHSSLILSVTIIAVFRSALTSIFQPVGESNDNPMEMDLLFENLKKSSN